MKSTMERRRRYLLLVAVLALLSQRGFGQNCPATLLNTAVYEGHPASFPRVDNGQETQWQVAPSSATNNPLRDITNYDDNVSSRFISTYTVNRTQLKIFKSTVEPQGSMPDSTAGLYILKYRNPDCTTAAGLVVIRNGPTCTCDAANQSNMQLSCRVEFAGFSNQNIHPIMTWKDNGVATVVDEQPQLTTVNEDNPGLKSSLSHLSNAINDGRTYECKVTLSTPNQFQPNYIAMNAPVFTASCFIKSCPYTTTNTVIPLSTKIATVSSTAFHQQKKLVVSQNLVGESSMPPLWIFVIFFLLLCFIAKKYCNLKLFAHSKRTLYGVASNKR